MNFTTVFFDEEWKKPVAETMKELENKLFEKE